MALPIVSCEVFGSRQILVDGSGCRLSISQAVLRIPQGDVLSLTLLETFNLSAFGEILVAGSELDILTRLPLESCKVFGSRKILIDCSECLTFVFSRVSILSIESESSFTFSIKVIY